MTKQAEKKVEKKEVDRTIPNSIAAQTFWMGTVPYRPRVVHTMDSWEKMQKHLIKGGVKGSVLAQELVQHTTKVDETHFDFLQYLVKRGALSLTKPEKKA